MGRHKVVSELRFIDAPLARSACRLTLPTDVVVFNVKTYFLKIRWIDLISSIFLLTPMLSPLTLRVLSLLSYLEVLSLRLPRGLDDLCLYPNRFDL